MGTETYGSGTVPQRGDTQRMLLVKEVLATRGITVGSVSGVTGVYGPTTGLFVGGVPTVVPAGDGAIAIDTSGTQFLYYSGAWH